MFEKELTFKVDVFQNVLVKVSYKIEFFYYKC